MNEIGDPSALLANWGSVGSLAMQRVWEGRGLECPTSSLGGAHDTVEYRELVRRRPRLPLTNC